MKIEAFRLYDFLFRHTFGRMQRFRAFSPDIEIIPNSLNAVRTLLAEELDRHSDKEKPVYLDVGGRRGEGEKIAQGYDYRAMDIKPQGENVVVGDICHCPEIEDNSYDVVASFDVFEHVERPWDAALECIRIVKPGGLLIHRTLFAYRYHPIPVDYWRFSSQGLEYLFTNTGEVETIQKGYDLRIRRRNARGGRTDLRDRPPVDWLGGFRENWRTLYIGRKL